MLTAKLSQPAVQCKEISSAPLSNFNHGSEGGKTGAREHPLNTQTSESCFSVNAPGLAFDKFLKANSSVAVSSVEAPTSTDRSESDSITPGLPPSGIATRNHFPTNGNGNGHVSPRVTSPLKESPLASFLKKGDFLIHLQFPNSGPCLSFFWFEMQNGTANKLLTVCTQLFGTPLLLPASLAQ
jgi:hypothetical protein